MKYDPGRQSDRGELRRVNSMRREHQRYRWTNRLLLGAFIAYLAVALETERVHGREDRFPVASWSLFSKVPNETTDYSLRLLEVRGERLADPVFFEDANRWLSNTRSHAARISIQRLGRAVAAKDEAEVARVRAYLEDLHLRHAGDATYQVVSRTYDPLARYRGEPIDNVRTRATFRVGQPDPVVAP